MIFVAVGSVPIAIWASREHRYRERLAAVAALLGVDSNYVNVQSRGAEAGSLHNADELLRDDVVVEVQCGISDRELSALLWLPTARQLSVFEPTDRDAEVWSAALGKLAALPALERLSLFGAPVTDDAIAHLAKSASLRALDLRLTNITDGALRTVASLEMLEELRLDGTAVTNDGVRLLGGLRSLRALDLGCTGITGAGLAHLSGLRRLERLALFDDDIGDEWLPRLLDLSALAELNLTSTRVSDRGLETLSGIGSLQTLGVAWCSISDAGLVHLSRMTSLRCVHLMGAESVTSDGVARLRRVRPDLDVRWESDAPMSDGGD